MNSFSRTTVLLTLLPLALAIGISLVEEWVSREPGSDGDLARVNVLQNDTGEHTPQPDLGRVRHLQAPLAASASGGSVSAGELENGELRDLSLLSQAELVDYIGKNGGLYRKWRDGSSSYKVPGGFVTLLSNGRVLYLEDEI